MKSVRLAVLASGSGSNLEAIAKYLESEGEKAGVTLALVISDRVKAPALEKARSRGIATVHLKDPFDAAELEAALKEHRIELVALAGYLKLIPPGVVKAYAGRILNVHPGPLPKFGGPGMYGLRVHQAVLDARDPLTAVTIHLVDEQYDHGAVIARWFVPVQPGDVAATLAARVLAVEHTIYPRVICAFATGTVSAQHPIDNFDPQKFPEGPVWKLIPTQ